MTTRYSPIPAWLRRRGYSPRAMLAIASAVERSARRREAVVPESHCQIIPFPKRPAAPAAHEAASRRQAGA
ncbi:hypothetical protein FF100_14075 [Methylobacterium terricola]|uniref:Uncharacterized protein n=1 Tax=Methylobacterium terricola TaxID=2583531 RepID=A0A5C4LI09_9HYPH|nr:hypothetical protein [Methylobacterium terricola]TNC12785.1 hypothetical protein FF100_14075 [Methylobacterium terricola]